MTYVLWICSLQLSASLSDDKLTPADRGYIEAPKCARLSHDSYSRTAGTIAVSFLHPMHTWTILGSQG